MQILNASIENNDTLEQLAQLASLEKENGNIKNAIIIYENLLNKFPQAIPIYTQLGNLYIEMAMYKKAFLLFQRALGIERNYQILFKMGMLFFQKYQFGEAVNFFMECVTAKPDFVDAHYYTAKSLSQLNQFNKAIFFLDKVLILNKKHTLALKEKISILYRLKKYKETKALAEQLISMFPEEYIYFRYLGFAELFSGNFMAAERAFENALGKNPFWKKMNHQIKSRIKKTEFDFPKDKNKLNDLESDYIQKEDHRSLGYLYFYRGEHEKAILSFEREKIKVAN